MINSGYSMFLSVLKMLGCKGRREGGGGGGTGPSFVFLGYVCTFAQKLVHNGCSNMC